MKFLLLVGAMLWHSMVVDAGQLGAHVRARLRSGNLDTEKAVLSEPAPTVPPIPAPWNVEPKRCATGYMHVGCVKDTQFQMRRWYDKHVAKEDRETMTVEVCWNFCRNVSGAQFFGLEMGRKCYCTPTFHSGMEVRAEDVCDIPCDGDATQMCGGDKGQQDMYEMHDCMNMPSMPCKQPPGAVAHAKLFKSQYYFGAMTPCSNAKRQGLETGKNMRCEIECEEGYYVAENTLKCVEMGQRMTYSWAQVTGSASCEPVVCGMPKQVRNAKYPRTLVEYPSKVTYACDVGYSVNGTAQGPKQQSVECRATGKFSSVEDCNPVRCGTCPTGQKYPNSVVRESDERVYREVCTYDCNEGYTLDQQAEGAKMFTITCLHTGEFAEPPTCSPVTCGAAPTLTNARALVLQSQDTAVVFPLVVNYECVHGYSLDRMPGGNTSFGLSCLADGKFSPAPECKAVLVGNPPIVKHSIYDDRKYYYGESVTYTCVTGYTMDGKPGGTNIQVLFTTPEGQWKGSAPVCMPVECGTLPLLAHASAVSPPSGVINFATSPVAYSCAAGYSTSISDDIWSPNKADFIVSCKADGTFSTKDCVNIDDCLIRNCGSHGTCVDLPNPTNLPLDNYDCKCESGFEITLHNSTLMAGELRKVCTNINDCPVPESCGGENAKGLARGLCNDLINAYSCTCGAGYQVASAGSNETCEPISCGTVPPAANATYTPALGGSKVNYDTPAWVVECSKGYSYDGQAGGPRSTTIACLSTGSLTTSPECVRVSCGAPRFVGNADMAPALPEMLYKDSVTYTCDEGHALKGDPKGLRAWEVSCLGSGTISEPDTEPGGAAVVHKPETTKPNVTTEGGRMKATPTATTTPLACLPVMCGTLPKQVHASWNATREYVYGQSARVDCDDGYSIDGSTSDAGEGYDVPCTSDGSFQTTAKCQRIVCADPPSFDHSAYSPAKGPFKFEDRVEYSIEPGFELQLPNGSKLNSTFECHCAANGEFNGTCAMDVTIAAISCGPAPQVAHATVTGSTSFGGSLTAKADKGYTLDGTAKGGTEFTFYCMASGRFSPRQKFERIVCGACPEVPNVERIDFIDMEAALLQMGDLVRNSSGSGLKTRERIAALHLQARRATRRSGKRLFTTKYGDIVEYICKEGYRAASGAGVIPVPVVPVKPHDPEAFELTCALNGDHAPAEAGEPEDVKCLPVTCDVHESKPADAHFAMMVSPFTRLSYQESMDYVCRPGLSLDGTPAGQVVFTETCTATGDISSTKACKDIDWCLVGKCGDHGKCVDGEYSYTCECDAGYEVAAIDSVWQTCKNIDECETQGGYGRCSVGGGKCVDALLKYSCECTEGHENVKSMSGRDSCAPVMCEALPLKANAFSKLQTQKISYGQSTVYTCGEGYSLDGTISGKKVFPVECSAKGTNTGLENECAPVMCEAAKEVKHASVVGEKTVHFGESVHFKCDVGATTNGQPVGSSNFSVPCLSSGKLGTYETCELISCGAPLLAVNAISKAESSRILYDETVPYSCVQGFSLNGKADGSKIFDATCGADGLFTGVQSCSAVSCGNLSRGDMLLAQYSFGEYRYPAKIGVVCDTGSTVDADPDGEGTFFVQCGAEGQFEGKQDCKLVKCPVPAPPKSESADKSGTVEYDQRVVYTCNAGYSTDGTAAGATKFQKQCEATGSLSRSSPDACVDIDYCLEGPCGANGECTDSGEGVPAPGYTCTCHEGFEVRKNSRGGDFCAADDCAGDPCGEGGTCSDLSKQGGPQGTYSCACDAGFELIEPEPMKYTCRRRVCGVLPNVSNTVELDGKPYSMVDQFGKPKDNVTLLSFEKATFECAPGYSTDQRTSPEGRSFSVACQANGRFHREVVPAKECLPVICQNPFLPSITHARLVSNGLITYGQKANYECSVGHTTTGALGGPFEFSIPCQANGTFARDKTQCLPISCEVPQRKNASASRSSLVYGEKVAYTCDAGHEIPHPVSPQLMFEGVCTEEGKVETGDAECLPVECGQIAAQPQAKEEPPAITGPLKFGDATRFVCLEGHTLGGVPGGDDSYQIACQASGELTGMLDSLPGGPPAGSGICKLAGYTVIGRVTDAEDAKVPLANAKVTFKENGTDAEAAIVYTDRDGMYEARLPPGAVIMHAEMTGYIAREKGPIVVASAMMPGQGTSIALSKTLPDGDWRIILNWEAKPKDLDSYVQFGCGLSQQVNVRSRAGASERAGGLTVSLDRDAALGWGPETTTIRGAGRCTTPGCCLIKFKVNHFSGGGDMGGSGAMVTVFKGESRVAKYTVPPCIGDKKWWTALTIDAWNGTNRLYEGDMKQPPYLDEKSDGISNWAISFDTMRWSTARSTSGNLAAITGLNMQSLKKLHKLDGAKYMEVRDGLEATPMCKDIDIEGTLEEEMWAECPAGFYLNGLYRTGSKFDKVSGLEQMTKARCCTANMGSANLRWGECHVQELSEERGWKECGASETGLATAMVGLHASYKGDGGEMSWYDGPLPKHAVTPKGIYLGGEYIQLGIRRDKNVGKMGTSEMPPAGFVPRADGQSGIGMVSNTHGFSKDTEGAFVIDYFLPGYPAEDFWVGYRHGGRIHKGKNCGQDTEDITPGKSPYATARVTLTLDGDLKVVTNITLGVNDKYFKTSVELTNVAKHALQDVRYVRTVDADNTVDQWGDFPTQMTVIGTVGEDGYAAVVAKSQPNDAYYEKTDGRQASLMYFSTHPNAKAAYNADGFLEAMSPYEADLYDAPPRKGKTTTIDGYMSMAFDFGTLPPGKSVRAEFYTALDDANVKDIIEGLNSAAEPELQLDEMKCCSVANQAPAPGTPPCAGL